MPNTSSAKKRLRQNHARRERNRAGRSALRSQIKKVRQAVAASNLEQADVELRAALRALDRAASRRLVHPNMASRLKSRLSALVLRSKQAVA